MPDKPLVWLGSSLRDIRHFPALARRLAGFQLRRVQQGLDPDDWKPMPTVGPGVREIRIQIAGAHRVFYVTTRPETIYVPSRVREEGAENERGRPQERPGAAPQSGTVEAAR
jgi:phage-related protein